MTVDQNSINDMANIMSLLEGHERYQNVVIREEAPEPKPSRDAGALNEDVRAMKAILEGFTQATESAVYSSTSQHDRTLKEAMVTFETDRGTQVGSWEIVKKEDESGFDVVHAQSGDIIAENLCVYEAAYALVKNFNLGVTINSKIVREILDLEDEYARNRTEAARQRQRTKRLYESGDNARGDIAQARFDEAKRRAVHARSKLSKLAGMSE